MVSVALGLSAIVCSERILVTAHTGLETESAQFLLLALLFRWERSSFRTQDRPTVESCDLNSGNYCGEIWAHTAKRRQSW